MLACCLALPTEWVGWVEVPCERWCMHTSPMKGWVDGPKPIIPLFGLDKNLKFGDHFWGKLWESCEPVSFSFSLVWPVPVTYAWRDELEAMAKRIVDRAVDETGHQSPGQPNSRGVQQSASLVDENRVSKLGGSLGLIFLEDQMTVTEYYYSLDHAASMYSTTSLNTHRCCEKNFSSFLFLMQS